MKKRIIFAFLFICSMWCCKIPLAEAWGSDAGNFHRAWAVTLEISIGSIGLVCSDAGHFHRLCEQWGWKFPSRLVYWGWKFPFDVQSWKIPISYISNLPVFCMALSEVEETMNHQRCVDHLWWYFRSLGNFHHWKQVLCHKSKKKMGWRAQILPVCCFRNFGRIRKKTGNFTI